MIHGMRTSKLVSRLVVALAVLTVLATACGSDDPSTIESPTTVAPADSPPGAGGGVTPPGGATGASTPTGGAGGAGGPAGQSGLPAGFAGLWAGEYKSILPPDADGTFTVVFEGAAPDYTGSIVIAGLCEPGCPITAKVTGDTIGFGSVGPRAVTYKGTIVGNSMSGSYTVGTEGQGNGTWTAVKK